MKTLFWTVSVLLKICPRETLRAIYISQDLILSVYWKTSLVSMFSSRCLNLLPSNFNCGSFNTFKLNGHRHEKLQVHCKWSLILARGNTNLRMRYWDCTRHEGSSDIVIALLVLRMFLFRVRRVHCRRVFNLVPRMFHLPTSEGARGDKRAWERRWRVLPCVFPLLRLRYFAWWKKNKKMTAS